MANLFDTPAMAAGYASSRPELHPRIIERVREHLGLASLLDSALDVGCGAGLSTRALELIAQHCVGVDPSAAMIKQASSVAPEAAFLVGSAEALPVPSGSIDIITAAGSLNFATMSLFYPEALRVLRPAGILGIYDFSEGSRFRNSASLERWYQEFLNRYPSPPDFGQQISPETLRSCDHGFRLSGHEYFDIGLKLTPDLYLDYVMSEMNVAQALADGVPTEQIRNWCAKTLESVFQGEAHEVVFQGYIAYLDQINSLPG